MAFPKRFWTYGVIVCLAEAAGCGGTRGREPRTYTRSGPPDPVADVRIFFEAYVNGQNLGSEVELYEDLTTAVKAIDPAKAAVIERGLADIMARPTAIQSIAAKVLESL
jgi:hypothetical protein